MSDVPDDLRTAAERAARRAGRSGRPAWLLWRRDASPRPPRLDPRAYDAFRFESAAHDFAIDATGAAAAVEAVGEQRFEDLRGEVARVTAALECVDHAVRPGTHPAWVGGFAFAPDIQPDSLWSGFPPARMVLPERLHVREGDAAIEHRAVRVEPGDSASGVLQSLLASSGAAPQPAAVGASRAVSDAEDGEDGEDGEHLLRIRRALASVHSGSLEKVVVALEQVFRGGGAHAPDAVFDALAARHPRCRAFLVKRGDVAFVGASPERLVRVARAEVRADALAGSAPRGATPERDARLARDLLESKKEQEEHAVVVRALRDALRPLCSDLVVPEAPRVRALAGIQHLHTPVTGRLRSDVDLPLLALTGRVHPTPAVAGAPRDAALTWLRAHEELDRGWYAGGIGWMDLGGQGEFFVALRSALLRDGEARLYAGAGIVADSDAGAELSETYLKLRPVLGALETCA